MMLPYPVWLDLTTEYIKLRVRGAGGKIRKVQTWWTGSRYIKVQNRHGLRFQIRLSHHRGRYMGPRVLSIRRAATGRLRELDGWLSRWASPEPSHTVPAYVNEQEGHS